MKDTKERIIQESARLFMQQTFDGTSVAEIGAAVGISPSSICSSFGTPDSAGVRSCPGSGRRPCLRERGRKHRLRRSPVGLTHPLITHILSAKSTRTSASELLLAQKAGTGGYSIS